jgi:hypothetical protein
MMLHALATLTAAEAALAHPAHAVLLGFGLRRLRRSVGCGIDQRWRGDCYSGGERESGHFRSGHRAFSIGDPAIQ